MRSMTQRLVTLSIVGVSVLGIPNIAVPAEGEAQTPLKPEMAAACAMLDDVDLRQRMDGLLFKLAVMCDRPEHLGQVHQEPSIAAVGGEAGDVDVPVNDPSGDTGASSHTQSETSLAYNEATQGVVDTTKFTIKKKRKKSNSQLLMNDHRCEKKMTW